MNLALLQNSLLVSGLATLLALAFGLAAAVSLMGLGPRGRVGLAALAIAAFALPPFLVTNCWLDLLGTSGALRPWLPLNIFSLGGAAWLLGLLLWPVPFFLVAGAWRRLEPAQLECDPLVSGWALLRGLLLPLAQRALAQAAVLAFVLALNNFAVPAILQVKVFPAETWIRFNTSFDVPGTLSVGWPLVLAPLLLLFWLRRQSLPWPGREAAVTPGLFRQQLGRGWFCGCAGVTAGLCLLAVGLPLLQLTLSRRTWTELPGALAAGQSAAWNSFSLAAASASLIIALALAAAAWEAGRAAGRGCFRPASLLPAAWLLFLIPGVLLGISLIALFNHSWSAGFYQGTGIVLLAFTLRYLGPGTSAVSHAAGEVDRDLKDAARLEGASRWQMLRHVYWPQIAPQVMAAWYIVFLLCLWDVESMLLVAPPGGETLALRIFNLLHYGHNAQVNALCLALLALALLPLAAWLAARAGRNAWRAWHPAVLAAAASASLLAGCSAKLGPSEARLDSSLFSAVRVIGSRGVGVGQLNKPRSVAVDQQDHVYAVDMTGRVQKFSPDGVYELSWQMPQTDLGKPKGMARDLEGDIIVVEPHYQRLNYFTPEGRRLGQWGRKGTNAGQLIMPRGAAVNSRGETFVCEYGEVERIQEFVYARSNGVASFVKSFGRPGTGPGEFNRAEGICVDAQDRLYVADSCNHRIQVFTPDGTFIRAYGKAGSGPGEFSYPYDICVDAAGRQYVCEFGNSRVQVFDANDRPVEIIGGPGAEPGRFNNPWGVALDSAGNLYVADSQNHRIQKLVRRQAVLAGRAPLAGRAGLP